MLEECRRLFKVVAVGVGQFELTAQQVNYFRVSIEGVNAAMYCYMINNNVVLLVFKNDQKPEKCALLFILNNNFSERNIHIFY